MEAPARGRFIPYFRYVCGYLFHFKVFVESSEVSRESPGAVRLPADDFVYNLTQRDGEINTNSSKIVRQLIFI
jgi:hypothetical protein